jgi:hypothetical protein
MKRSELRVGATYVNGRGNRTRRIVTDINYNSGMVHFREDPPNEISSGILSLVSFLKWAHHEVK